MSHLTVYKTKLKNLNKQLLQNALQSLAGKIGANVTNFVNDYYGSKTHVDVALNVKSLPRGIGFSVDNQGNLLVKGDAYDYEPEFNRVSTLAENYVKAYMVAENARLKHPLAQMQIKPLQREVAMVVEWME